MASKLAGCTGDPGFVEGHARNRGENVDAIRRPSELNDTVGRGQVVHRDVKVTKAEAREHFENPPRVFGTGVDEEINVAGEPRMAVKRDGMTADDEVLNTPRVEQSDKLAQICLQLRQESSCAARSGREGSQPAR